MRKIILLIFFALIIAVNGITLDEIKLSIKNWNNCDSITKVIKYFQNKTKLNNEEYGYYVKALYYYGNIAKTKKQKIERFLKGIDIAKKGEKLYPKNIMLLYYYAAILGKYGETKGVLKSLSLVKPIKNLCNEIISIDPNYAGAYHILGVMMRKLPKFAGGNKKKSYQYLKKATELEPTFSLHWLELAKSALKIKKKKEAINILKKIVNETFPKDHIQEKEDKAIANKMLKILTK